MGCGAVGLLGCGAVGLWGWGCGGYTTAAYRPLCRRSGEKEDGIFFRRVAGRLLSKTDGTSKLHHLAKSSLQAYHGSSDVPVIDDTLTTRITKGLYKRDRKFLIQQQDAEEAIKALEQSMELERTVRPPLEAEASPTATAEPSPAPSP